MSLRPKISFRPYKDVDFATCSPETLKQAHHELLALKAYLPQLESKGNANLVEELRVVQIFSMIDKLLRVYISKGMMSECSEIAIKVVPYLLVCYLVDPKLNQSIFAYLRNCFLTMNIQQIYSYAAKCVDRKHLDDTGGVLSFSLLSAVDENDFPYATKIGSGVCNYFVTESVRWFTRLKELSTALTGPIDDDRLLHAIKPFVLLDPVILHPEGELMSILLRNDRTLISKLENYYVSNIGKPIEVKDLNSCCIKTLFGIIVCTCTINGIELDAKQDSILYSKITNRTALKFMPGNSQSLKNSFSFLMESVQHEKDLKLLRSFNLSMYYFLSMKEINRQLRENELNVYRAYNSLNCKISLVSLFLISVVQVTSNIVYERNNSLRFPASSIKNTFNIFELPPTPKSKYLLDTKNDIDFYQLSTFRTKNSLTVTHGVRGLLWCWKSLEKLIPRELQVLSNFKEKSESVYFALVDNFLDMVYGSMYCTAFLNISLRERGSVNYQSIISFLNILFEMQEPVSESNREIQELIRRKFLSFSGDLLSRNLEYYVVFEMLISSIELTSFLRFPVLNVMLSEIIRKYRKGKDFDRAVNELCGIEVWYDETDSQSVSSNATNSAPSSTDSSVDVPLSIFDSLLKQENLGDSPKSNKSTGGNYPSQSAMNIQAKRDGLFAASSRDSQSEYTNANKSRSQSGQARDNSGSYSYMPSSRSSSKRTDKSK